MDDKQLAKLIRKNLEKAAQPNRGKPARQYDATLPKEESEDEDVERTHFFKEMKRREF